MTEKEQPSSNDLQEESKSSRRINWFLILLIAAPFALLVGRALATGGLIGYMRTADVGDLLILSPLYAIILIYLLYYMSRYGAPGAIMIAFISFSFLFIFGQAMHLTANAINTFATEVRDYREILPDDLYTLIFDLDERLSHWILMGSAIGLIGTWFIYDRQRLSPPVFPNNLYLIIIVGVIWGSVMAISVIEARIVFIAIPVILFLAALWIWYWRRSGQSLANYTIQRPFTGFVAVLIIYSLTFMLVWGVLNRGFPQPSELGL